MSRYWDRCTVVTQTGGPSACSTQQEHPRVWIICARRRLPSAFQTPWPPCLAVFIKRSYEEGVGGEGCVRRQIVETPGHLMLSFHGNSFASTSPTHMRLYTQSLSHLLFPLWKGGVGGTELVVPKVVLGPSDVKLMFIIADNLLVLILEKIPGSSGALGRNSAGFQCWGLQESCPTEGLWVEPDHFVQPGRVSKLLQLL